MEYKKESEKFSFGIGTQKVAGKGSLAETNTENAGLAKILLPVAVSVGAGILKMAVTKKLHKNK